VRPKKLACESRNRRLAQDGRKRVSETPGKANKEEIRISVAREGLLNKP
jgi:hypothetical protein